MKSLIALLLISALATVLPAKDTEPSTAKTKEAAQVAKPKQRIEEVFKNNRKLIRFHDKNWEKTKEIDLESKETKVRINKDKVFDPSSFKLKISSQIAGTIEETRKSSGRDVELYRSESRKASFSGNKQFVVVEDGYLDFVDFADSSDAERSEDPIEIQQTDTVYNLDGIEIIKLTREEGGVAAISNTGEFLVLVTGEAGERLINRKKEILAEIPFHADGIYFSANDRFIVFTKLTYGSDKCSISIFDTHNNKLELEKLVVSNLVFKNIERMEISETKREIIIQHSWDIKTKQVKTDKLQF